MSELEYELPALSEASLCIRNGRLEMTHSDLKLNDLSQTENDALVAYKAASQIEGYNDCFDLNRDLRCGLCPDELPDRTRGVAAALDSVFARGPKTKSAITVYRAVGFAWHLPLHEKGRDFRSSEYWSTSSTRDGALSFLKPSGCDARGAILTLHLPIGLPVYNMETLAGFYGEAEILLPRGIRWTVCSFRLLDKAERSQWDWMGFKNIVEATLQAHARPRNVVDTKRRGPKAMRLPKV